MKKTILLCAVALFSASPASAAQATPAKLKVYVSVDMEGVAGTVTSDQLGPTGFEYARYREFMTREALAAVRAAKAAGASEVLVADAHGNGENLLIELFPADVRVVRSWPRRLGMMAGLDASFDAAIFIGYHASTDSLQGVRAHTFSSARLTHLAVNGRVFGEGAWNAAIAGHFGVPVVMASGDDAALRELREALGEIETAEVKRALGFHSAATLTPEASYALIEARAAAALRRLADFKPLRVATPVTVDVGFKHYRPAEVLAFLPLFERTSAHSVRYRAKDMPEASDVMVFLTNYDLELEP